MLKYKARQLKRHVNKEPRYDPQRGWEPSLGPLKNRFGSPKRRFGLSKRRFGLPKHCLDPLNGSKYRPRTVKTLFLTVKIPVWTCPKPGLGSQNSVLGC